MNLISSTNYSHSITVDGSDSGNSVGSLSATVDNANHSISININVNPANSEFPSDDKIIQTQLDTFIQLIRSNANLVGLTYFNNSTVSGS